MANLDNVYAAPGLRANVALDSSSRAAVQPAGRKDDSNKLDLTLFFDDLPNAIEGVAQVLQWAVKDKLPVPYERGSWQAVPDFQRRYRAAMLRHQVAQAKARQAGKGDMGTDWETGLLELQHIATDAMFMLEMAMRERAKEKANAAP